MNGPVSKTGRLRKGPRGFESRPLRQRGGPRAAPLDHLEPPGPAQDPQGLQKGLHPFPLLGKPL